MSLRHAHPKGLPRRTWAIDGEPTRTMPVYDDVVPVLDAEQTEHLLRRFSFGLREVVQAEFGVTAAWERISMRYSHPAAPFVATLARNVVLCVAVFGTPAAVVGVLYAVGV